MCIGKKQKFLNFYEWFKERCFLRGEKPFLNTQYVALAKKGFSLPLNPFFPKNFNYRQYIRYCFLVKKFGKKKEFEGGNNPFQRVFPPSKFTFFQTNIKSWGISG